MCRACVEAPSSLHCSSLPPPPIDEQIPSSYDGCPWLQSVKEEDKTLTTLSTAASNVEREVTVKPQLSTWPRKTSLATPSLTTSHTQQHMYFSVPYVVQECCALTMVHVKKKCVCTLPHSSSCTYTHTKLNADLAVAWLIKLCPWYTHLSTYLTINFHMQSK